MGTGTATMGKHSTGKSHIQCRRCGEHSYHVRKKFCSGCGFGRSARLRSYAWQNRNGKY
ncbi:50S ribosomal protein L37e [Candidatus Woesearchaeota archaeon]|nr:50S ribosomal protein L37e [Candidatus Woesearchaeota archaeon]